MFKQLIMLLIATTFFISCESERRAEIIEEKILVEGEKFALETAIHLMSNLKKKMGEDGVEEAVQYCSVNAINLTKEIEDRRNIKIKRATHKPRNPMNKADEEEMKALEMYIKALESGEELKPMVAKDGSRRFFSPIKLNQTCLPCHGTPNRDISEEVLAKIDDLYPEDKARNFKAGDIRGIWSIKF